MVRLDTQANVVRVQAKAAVNRGKQNCDGVKQNAMFTHTKYERIMTSKMASWILLGQLEEGAARIQPLD